MSYLYFMACYGFSSFYWELENCGRGCSYLILPEDTVNVGGVRVFPARVFLPLKAAVVRIVELDNEPVDGVSLLLHINQNSTASVGEAIQSVDVVGEHNLPSNLQVQFCLERRVLDASGIVHFKCLYSPARIFRFHGEQFSLHLLHFGFVPSIDLGIGSIYVDGIVHTGVRTGTDSGLQQGDVIICIVSCPHPVQQVTVDLVLTLAMVLFQVNHSEKLPQVSE